MERTAVAGAAKEIAAAMDPGGRLYGLDAEMADRARLLLYALAYMGYGQVTVVCGWRSREEQARLYGYGRTVNACRKAGVKQEYARPDEPIRTKMRPGNSQHELGRAVDLEFHSYHMTDYRPVGYAARLAGVRWGGDWRMRDYGHFELVAGKGK